MNTTYSITEAQAKLPGVVRESQDSPVIITRHDKTVAYVVSKQRMDAISESLEILANPEAVKTIQDAREGKTNYQDLDEIFTD